MLLSIERQSLRDRDLDGAVVLAGGMLDVDPRPALVRRVEVEPGELRAERAVRRPPTDSLAGVSQVAVLVEVTSGPDVVVDAAVAVLDDVDVALVVDGQVVRAGVRAPTGRPVARSVVLRSAKTEIRWPARSST